MTPNRLSKLAAVVLCATVPAMVFSAEAEIAYNINRDGG
jgi:hypothetical protein